MKIKYVHRSKEIGDGVIADLDKQGKLIDLEVLAISKKYKGSNVSEYFLEDLVNSKTLEKSGCF